MIILYICYICFWFDVLLCFTALKWGIYQYIIYTIYYTLLYVYCIMYRSLKPNMMNIHNFKHTTTYHQMQYTLRVEGPCYRLCSQDPGLIVLISDILVLQSLILHFTLIFYIILRVHPHSVQFIVYMCSIYVFTVYILFLFKYMLNYVFSEFPFIPSLFKFIASIC